MTNSAYRQQPMLRRVGVIACFALAVATAACSSSDEAPAETSASPTSTPAPETVTATAAPPSTVTVTAPSPATVTITPPEGRPGVNVEPITGPFQSPSGNIRCTMFDSDGRNTVRCEVVQHAWQAPPRSPDCQLNWGDRVELTEDSPAVFSCYGQNLPEPQATLDYGKVAIFGSISCNSQVSGILCLDNDTGHFFNVSRDLYQVG
ncbi:DUF6636 domain-containing protein [Mycobacterium sp. NPDC051804]|uniref:DUF6636 domain-containing protein n=1 Tax=Mycobacterium sp. NPDC051804 TaxID=3364295 RepID=UPI0037A2C6C5